MNADEQAAAKRPRADSEREHKPAATLSDSKLTFDDLKTLKHVVVAHQIAEEPEVAVWHADIVELHPKSRTADMRIREWRRVVCDVPPEHIYKPSAALPAV